MSEFKSVLKAAFNGAAKQVEFKRVKNILVAQSIVYAAMSQPNNLSLIGIFAGVCVVGDALIGAGNGVYEYQKNKKNPPKSESSFSP